jgi:hypothetical protein
MLIRKVAAALLPILLAGNGLADHSSSTFGDACGTVRASKEMTAGDVVFEKARAPWSAGAYPHVIAFTVAVHGELHSKLIDSNYHGEQDISAGSLRVSRFSEQEMADPYVPTGINLGFGLTLNGRPAYGAVYSNAPTRDILGPPHLSPLYSFGLSRELRVSEQITPPPDGSLVRIGSVSSTARAYNITCAFEERGGGSGQFVLTFHPLRDPARFRLREMWIDADSFSVLRLRTAGNFSAGPPTKTDWLITFQTIDGAIYIQRETAMAPLNYGEGKVYENVYLEFKDLRARRMPSLTTDLPQFDDPDDLHEP